MSIYTNPLSLKTSQRPIDPLALPGRPPGGPEKGDRGPPGPQGPVGPPGGTTLLFGTLPENLSKIPGSVSKAGLFGLTIHIGAPETTAQPGFLYVVSNTDITLVTTPREGSLVGVKSLGSPVRVLTALIDNQSQMLTLVQYACVVLQYSGGSWYIVGGWKP